MDANDIVLGEYYRLKNNPKYSFVKPLRIIQPRTGENKNNFIVVECEHVVNKGDLFGFIRLFSLKEIIQEEQPDFGSCSSCGGEVQFGKMAEHTCPDEKGKDNEKE